MPVEQVLVRPQEKGPGAAGGVENAELGGLFGTLVFQQLANRVLDDVIDDIRRCVVDTASFLDFRLILDLCLMASGQTNDLAEELFVNLAKNLSRKHLEFVGAVRVIKRPND